jgi:metal-responsive CopG/Arc/MetJ family transcriptional regulator
MKATTQTFNVSFPRALVSQIDAKAEEQFASRSDFLRAAALQYLRNEQEWGKLFADGKEIGSQAKPLSEEEVAAALTAKRRADGRWFKPQQ